MIYDTLFGMDSSGNIAPQMVDTYEMSSDRKTWTFTLRPGLEFHDGTMVTSDDVIASLERWTQRDNMGLVMRSFVERWEVADANTFRILLKEPYGMMLETLGKAAGSAPFIMPKRVAATPSDKQIDDYTGSGPFIFKTRRMASWGKDCLHQERQVQSPRPRRPTEPREARSQSSTASNGLLSRILKHRPARWPQER